MVRKVAFRFVLYIVIVFTLKSFQAKQDISDEDVEETSEIVINYLSPLLELNDYTIEDVPNHLTYLTAKYYLIFSRGVEPLDTLEQMVSDYQIIQSSRQKVAEEFGEYVERFVNINSSDDRKALEKFISKMLKSFDFRLQVVSPRDALKFLLYQEAYPDIAEIISVMVRKHYDAYRNERSKAKGHSPEASNDTESTEESKSTEDDDFDAKAAVREFVATHGRLELVKRMLNHLESYLPPLDRSTINDSTLDYLDDLRAFLETEIYRVWRFIKDSAYKTTTDEWTTSAEKLYRDLITVIPLQEILNYVDAIAINASDRRALLYLGHERLFRNVDATPNRDATRAAAKNAGDVLNIISEAVIDDVKSVRDILHNIVTGTHTQVSEDTFLKYINQLLAPHEMSTNDLSEELRYTISRTFIRFNSIAEQTLDDTEKKTLETDVLSFRKNLNRLRDAIGILIPEQTESNHIEADGLLQSIVNKFGAFAEATEEVLVNVFNVLTEDAQYKKLLAAKIRDFAEKGNLLDLNFKESGKKPSDFLKERLSEVAEFIDAFIDSTTF